MNALYRSIAKKVAYGVAACLVVLAILILITRLASFFLNKHRTDIEAWATQLLAVPVSIDKVSISWYQYQPKIDLNGVTALGKDTHQPILQVQKVSVIFSLPLSVWRQEVVTSGIMIDGTDLTLSQNKAGEITLKGFPAIGGFNAQPFQSETAFKDVMAWLSTQSRIILRDIDVRYTDRSGVNRFVSLYNLSLTNNGNQHRIYGKAVLHQDIPTDVMTAIQWQGDPQDLAQVKADMYFYVTGVSLKQWLKDMPWQNWQIKDGVGSAKLWASWDKGALQRVQSLFQVYALTLYSQTDKAPHYMNRVSGDIGWRRDGLKQIIAGNDIIVDFPSHLWPVDHFYVSLEPDENNALIPKVLNIGYVDLNDLQTWLAASPPMLSPAMQKTLAALKLKGSLENVNVAFSGKGMDWKGLAFNAQFNRLSFLPYQNLPGVDNFSGDVKWYGSRGDVTINSNLLTLEDNAIFAAPIEIDQLSGTIHVQQNPDQSWVLSMAAMQLLNNDLTANVNGTLTFPVNGEITSDLKANFSLQKAAHVSRYLPMRLFDKELSEWLGQAFLSGEVNAGRIVLRGKINDYPFDHNKGEFTVAGAVNHIDLRYAPDWPALRQIQCQLLVSGRKMTIDLDHAVMQDIVIGKTHAEIPALGSDTPQVLTIKTNPISLDFAQGLRFIHTSPLEKDIGKMFANMQITGPVILNLDLRVPLDNPDKINIDGTINMTNANMLLAPWSLSVTQLNGLLHFTEHSTDAKGITGLLFNKPLKFDLSTITKSAKQSLIRSQFTTHVAINDLESWLKLPASSVVTGATDVNGTLDFSFDLPIQMHFASNLTGVTVNLQNEYAKKANDARPFTADITIQDNQPLRMKLGYGKLLSAALVLGRKHETFALTGANLQLGGGEPAWPKENGLFITGHVAQLDWDKIKSYLGQANTSDFSALSLSGIDVQIGKLDLFGQHLTDTRLELTPSSSYWDIDITSPTVSGEVQVPVKFTHAQQITAHFDKLNLESRPSTVTPASLDIDIKSLPAISLVANNVSYNHLPLGQITLKTAAIESGLTIQTLRIHSPRVDLQASGSWVRRGSGDVTQMRGTAKSDHVSDFINSLGGDASNVVLEKGSLVFNLSWNNGFIAPNLATLSGDASLDLGAGRIVDIGESSNAKMSLGRMLSIFSLQTIPRRLSFDFSDLFQKGYSFDFIRGDFKFTNGNAFTSNLRFEGPVAQIGIHGRIGLSRRDMDFTLSVSPVGVTSPLPVAAAWLAGPAGGLAALALNTVIGSQISKAATYYYTVSGSWANPSWEEIKTKTPTPTRH